MASEGSQIYGRLNGYIAQLESVWLPDVLLVLSFLRNLAPYTIEPMRLAWQKPHNGVHLFHSSKAMTIYQHEEYFLTGIQSGIGVFMLNHALSLGEDVIRRLDHLCIPSRIPQSRHGHEGKSL